ncbi:MAG: adenosylmethionine-8-amino-7-oxononanoate aminotransferase [Planctomycetota bacterium]|jgi:adenosylmethionine-8-amino-7-oxononanoate aminotransferase
MTQMPTNLVARDRAHLWHPYTQHATEAEPLSVASAAGSVITLEDGTQLIDAISSWWATLHGHGHPRIVQAMSEQVQKLDHVLFAGATHEPAVKLAEELLKVTPPGLTRVFYSDNGSTAVEVALKMVRQVWCHEGQNERRVFLSLEGAYHGDTFGSMAVGDPDPFFLPFKPMLFEARRVPANANAIAQALEELGPTCAGVILEPLVQGAAGMLMQSTSFLREVRAHCDKFGVPLIADEVMTGFGRTGELFACNKAGIRPDILCLAKGLTGGNFPLSATLTTERYFEAFLSEDRTRAFFHGHTFTGNPVGCAVGLASLQICREEDTPARLESIGTQIEAQLAEALDGDERVQNLRRVGGIVALDLVPATGTKGGYLSSLQPILRAAAIERGVLLRPLGNVLYALPPSSTTSGQCERIAEVMIELVRLSH